MGDCFSEIDESPVSQWVGIQRQRFQGGVGDERSAERGASFYNDAIEIQMEEQQRGILREQFCYLGTGGIV